MSKQLIPCVGLLSLVFFAAVQIAQAAPPNCALQTTAVQGKSGWFQFSCKQTSTAPTNQQTTGSNRCLLVERVVDAMGRVAYRELAGKSLLTQGAIADPRSVSCRWSSGGLEVN